MTALPSTFPGKIQIEETIFKAGVSEYFAQKIGRIANFLADKQLAIQTFTSSGTFTTGSNTSLILAYGAGAGAGGTPGQNGTNNPIIASPTGGQGGTGGGAGEIALVPLIVTPSTNYAITIGAGGGSNANGGATMFDSLYTWAGGLVGRGQAPSYWGANTGSGGPGGYGAPGLGLGGAEGGGGGLNGNGSPGLSGTRPGDGGGGGGGGGGSNTGTPGTAGIGGSGREGILYIIYV